MGLAVSHHDIKCVRKLRQPTPDPGQRAPTWAPTGQTPESGIVGHMKRELPAIDAGCRHANRNAAMANGPYVRLVVLGCGRARQSCTRDWQRSKQNKAGRRARQQSAGDYHSSNQRKRPTPRRANEWKGAAQGNILGTSGNQQWHQQPAELAKWPLVPGNRPGATHVGCGCRMRDLL